MAGKCVASGCDRDAIARQLCDKHYRRLRNNGDPELIRRCGAIPIGAICAANGCDRRVLAKGLCGKHYQTLQTHGDANYVRPERSIEERFMSMVEKAESGCWLWTGTKNASGYGLFSIDGKLVTASRFSFEFFKEKLGQGLFALHRCDNPPCVNPNHLWPGTRGDNHADMRAKGRARYRTGPTHHHAVLAEEQVKEIRARHAAGESQANLARSFGVRINAIHLIVHRKTWKHI